MRVTRVAAGLLLLALAGLDPASAQKGDLSAILEMQLAPESQLVEAQKQHPEIWAWTSPSNHLSLTHKASGLRCEGKHADYLLQSVQTGAIVGCFWTNGRTPAIIIGLTATAAPNPKSALTAVKEIAAGIKRMGGEVRSEPAIADFAGCEAATATFLISTGGESTISYTLVVKSDNLLWTIGGMAVERDRPARDLIATAIADARRHAAPMIPCSAGVKP